MSRCLRVEFLLFLATFFAFAYFNQGGGWNQNARFAEVRAMAEERRFAIDNYLVYLPSADGTDVERKQVERAEFEAGGKRHRLAWVDGVWNLFPVGEHPVAPGTELAAMVEICSSGDIGYVEKTGHFHPNKPPGTSMFALPAYLGILAIERKLGVDPDHWWTMNVNAWLCGVFSVGLTSAIGCVLFFRLARQLAGGAQTPALLATIALAFGTTFFPFGTVFFDHNLTAALLIAAFYFLHERGGFMAPMLAGLCAGMATLTNYVAGAVVIMFGLYALFVRRRPTPEERVDEKPGWNWGRAVLYSIGGLPAVALLVWYNTTNFGTPFALNTDFQNPLFKTDDGFLGMFEVPSQLTAYVAALLTVSPYRGVFFLCPILILAVSGAFAWMREKLFLPETRLCLGVFGFFFVVNCLFNGYHAGFSAGPRYLVPGLPFLALPLVVAFQRWPVFSGILAVVSIVQQLLLTATDAQNPLAVGGHARLPDSHRRDDFWSNLVADYAWPLFAYGRAWPVINSLIAIEVEKRGAELSKLGYDEAAIAEAQKAHEERLRASIHAGEPQPMLLGAIRGPVSVNPLSVYEGLLGFYNFQPGTPPTDWASFNMGELLSKLGNTGDERESVWFHSRLSLLPLGVVSGGLLVLALGLAGRADGRVRALPPLVP